MSLAIRAGRRIVRVARPEKRLFPSGITKAELARYYAAVAPAMLPHVAGRPLNLERYPDGIGGRHDVQDGQHGAASELDLRDAGGGQDRVVGATSLGLAGYGRLGAHALAS